MCVLSKLAHVRHTDNFFSSCNFYHCKGCEVCARLWLNYKIRCIILTTLLEIFIQNMKAMQTNYQIVKLNAEGDIQPLVIATNSELTMREQMEMTLLIIYQLYHLNIVSPVPANTLIEHVRSRVKEAERLASDAAEHKYFSKPDPPQHAFSFEILRTFAYKFLCGARLKIESKDRFLKFSKFTTWILLEV